MISQTAWHNILWLKKSFFGNLQHIGGTMFAVDSFRPYLTRNWVTNLKPITARNQLFGEVSEWAEKIKVFRLTREMKMDHWDEGLQVARGGEEYSRLINFLFRSHYNLYSLSYNRKTIEELALSAYAYSGHKAEPNEDIEKAALADFRRLMRLSNTFLLAEWVQDMIVRAISNNDKRFFNIIANAVKVNLLHESSESAVQWLLVALLWFLGGKDYGKRRDFINDLYKNGIILESIDEWTFNAELRRLGLTTS